MRRIFGIEWVEGIDLLAKKRLTTSCSMRLSSRSDWRNDLRDGAHPIDGADRQRIRDPDQLARPAYHLIDWKTYTNTLLLPAVPMSCSFCDVMLLGTRSVFRSLEATIDEIEMLYHQFGQQTVSIVDDTFVLNRERVTNFCHKLIERRSELMLGLLRPNNLMTLNSRPDGRGQAAGQTL